MKKWKWLWVWIAQIVLMCLLGLGVAFCELYGQIVYGILAYAVLPLLGAVTACFVTVHGLWNYAAWIAPPACMTIMHVVMWGFLPEPGPMLVCAFVSLVGAATGQVLTQRKAGRKR